MTLSEVCRNVWMRRAMGGTVVVGVVGGWQLQPAGKCEG
jgi:hypothetical protein